MGTISSKSGKVLRRLNDSVSNLQDYSRFGSVNYLARIELV